MHRLALMPTSSGPSKNGLCIRFARVEDKPEIEWVWSGRLLALPKGWDFHNRREARPDFLTSLFGLGRELFAITEGSVSVAIDPQAIVGCRARTLQQANGDCDGALWTEIETAVQTAVFELEEDLDENMLRSYFMEEKGRLQRRSIQNGNL